MINKRILLTVLSLLILGGLGSYFYNQKLRPQLPKNLDEHILTINHPYLQQVQPILNNKCVACHSCFNAPCQLDLTSFEGIQRGASKTNIYDFPLLKANPATRIGIDAHTKEEWRKKDFFSVLEGQKGSILARVLNPKFESSETDHLYLPEEERSCVSERDDRSFFATHPRGHMPYGFPDLTPQESTIIMDWLSKGSPAPSQTDVATLRKTFHSGGEEVLRSWEAYFNTKDFKSRLRSRYIYEHLFLATLTFEELPGEHYRLIRAKNLTGEPLELATIRPYEKTSEPFHYRFQKLIRTVMDKTHMPYPLSNKRRARWIELFDKPALLPGSSEFPAYGEEGSNAFRTFKRLPSKNRYQFMIDDAYYHVMTFIKGPVCRGPTALGVINDHFWVMFVDPDKDRSLEDDRVQAVFEKKMFPPASADDKLKSFTNFKKGYWSALEEKYAYYKRSQKKFDPSFVWDGGPEKNPSALLSIYRHNDSSSVLYGSQGFDPKTVWLLDYQVFEDIYYNLVAGYNVFAPYIHQVNTRLYMEISRIAAEDLFLTMIKGPKRKDIRDHWSMEVPDKRKSLGQEVVEVFVGSTVEKMNKVYPYLGADLLGVSGSQEELLKEIFDARFKGKGFVTEYESELDKIARPALGKKGPFVKFFPDATFIKIDGMEEELFTLIRNKYHYNVSMLKFEENRLEPAEDTLDLIHGPGASYPNLYLEVKKEEAQNFFHQMEKLTTEEDYKKFLTRFAVSRHQDDFWEKHVWFNKKNERGRFDLSRYEQY